MWLRRIAWGLGALVLVAGGVLAYLAATFDPNRYKGVLVDWVRTQYQRELVLDGPIGLGVWPNLHVKLGPASLSEHQRPGQRFAAIQALELSVRALPLFSGELRVDRVRVRGVALRYERDAQGLSNIDDLLKQPGEPVAEDGQGRTLSFDVAGISLENASVEVRDAMTGVEGRVALDTFDSGRLADGVRAHVALQAQAMLDKPRKAQVKLKGSLAVTPLIAERQVLAEKVALEIEADDELLKQAKATLKAGVLRWHGASQTVAADALEMDIAGQLGSGTPGPQTLSIEKAALSLDKFEYAPPTQTLQLSKLAVSLKTLQAGQRLTAELAWPTLAVKGDTLQGSPLEGTVALTGPVALEGSFKSQAPAGSFTRLKVPGLGLDFKLTMAGQGGTREVAGQLKGELDVQPAAGQLALASLNLNARIQEPALQPLNVLATGSVQAASSPVRANWALQGQLNANPFKTQGQATLGQGAPKVQATAHFDALDLNRLLPAPTAAPAASGPAGPQAVDVPLDLAGLKAVDGRFELSAGQLAWRQFRVADARILALLEGGKLTLQNLSGQAWNGRFQAKGTAQAGAPQRVALQANADGVNILAMLKDVANKEVLEGTGQVRLDVRSAGASVNQLTAALDGTAALVLRDGAVRGINLAKSFREAKARLSGGGSGGGDAVQQARQTEKTDFTEMSASFQIDQGVARNKDLSAKSPFLRVGGEGSIDLVRRRLDYTVNTTVTGTAKGQDGADIDMLKGLTVPVRLSGPFDAPDWKIAWSGVAVGAMKNTVKDQLKDKLEGGLKDKLLGKPEPAASGASAPAVKPEEAARQKLKDKLKGLLR